MIQRRNVVHTLFGALSAFSTVFLNKNATQKRVPACSPVPAIVGAWHLEAVGAPILHHCLVFHADGIVCSFQADGGFPTDSESDGAGSWQMVGNQAKGVFLEFRYDRASHAYLGSVRVAFTLTVHGDRFSGEAQACVYDAQENLLEQAQLTWSATRIVPQTPP